MNSILCHLQAEERFNISPDRSPKWPILFEGWPVCRQQSKQLLQYD